MKQNKIFAVVKQPNGSAEILLVEKEPKSFSAAVEGKRELIPFPSLSSVCVIFDGDAAEKKKPCCFLPEYNDLITGTVIFAGIDFATGFISLTEEQADKIMEYAKANDAKDFNGNVEEKIASGYLPASDENQMLGILSEIKTKYKSVKIKWFGRR